jgi:ribonuclease BN (tRNA processing enzyme)
MGDDMKIKIYGSRGSIPFFNRNSVIHGCNTSCIKIEALGRTLIFDCGSGLMQYQNELIKGENIDIDVFISHLHIDHIIGLSTFHPLWNSNHRVRLYTKSRSAEPLPKQIFGIFKPPYWPVDIEKINLAETIEIHNDTPLYVGGIKITPFASNHPNDTTAFRIEADKSFVHLVDHEHSHDPAENEHILKMCGNADCIIYDAAYLPEDYEQKKGWGHSTYEHGIALAKAARASQIIFTHFDPKYDDNDLSLTDNGFPIGCRLAKDGLEVEI